MNTTSFSRLKRLACVLSALASTLVGFYSAAAQSGGRGIKAGAGDTSRRESAQKRVALVVGNAAYAASPLKNPVNDARAVALALRELGFEVVYKENQTQNELKRAIRAFGEQARDSKVRLFYYAGHGMQVNGENYLIPTEADIGSEQEVEYEAINAGLVLAQMESARPSINIVILDACRNNPFARSFRSASRGLAVMNAPSGTLIAYATSPGSVAADGAEGNGVYTQELLRYMRLPGLSVEEVFKRIRVSVRDRTQGKQTPWEASSLTGDFYFAAEGQAGKRAGAGAERPDAAEVSFWDSIKNSADPEDYRSYLERFPDGIFAELARRRIQSTQAGKSASGGGTEGDAAAGAVGRKAASVKAKFFTFDLQQCRKSGQTVTCDLTVTNDEGSNRLLSFYRLDAGRVSKLFDDYGNEVVVSENGLANKDSYTDATLIPGLAVRARATFEGVSPQARSVKLLSLWFNTIASGYIVDSFKVEFRDVPLSQ